MRPPVHIVAIAGRKSLGGKTALCLGLAAHYFRAGHRVLVVDLDPRGIASLALGVPAGEADGEHLAAVLNGHAEPEPTTMPCGLQLLAGGPALATLANPLPLRDALDVLLDGVEFEVVLVDCPPGHPTLDMLALNAAAPAGAVLAATEPHRLGFVGAARVLDEARTLLPSPRCAVVLGRFDERREMDRAAKEELAAFLPNAEVLIIHQDTAMAAALHHGGLPPNQGTAAQDVLEVVTWLHIFGPRWVWRG